MLCSDALIILGLLTEAGGITDDLPKLCNRLSAASLFAGAVCLSLMGRTFERPGAGTLAALRVVPQPESGLQRTMGEPR